MTGSPHRDPANACKGKARFIAYADAMRAARRQRDNRTTTANAYRCAHCNGWHIGSRSQGTKPSDRNSKRKTKAALDLYRPSGDDFDNSKF